MQSESNPMHHEPSGFLGHAEIATDFVTADAVLAVHEKPHGGKPFVQADRRVFENCRGLQREAGLIMLAVALPDARVFKIGYMLRTTVRAAHDAIWPAQFHHELAAVFV